MADQNDIKSKVKDDGINLVAALVRHAAVGERVVVRAPAAEETGEEKLGAVMQVQDAVGHLGCGGGRAAGPRCNSAQKRRLAAD